MLLTIKWSNADKKTGSLRVEPKATIASLKKQLTDEYGGNLEYYQLTYKDKELNNEAATLEDCSISGDHSEILVCDSFFIVTIRGPFPLFEQNTLKVTHATTIARIKEEVVRLHDYATPNEFDLLHNGLSLVNGTVGKHKITSNDILAVTERIVTQLEQPRRKSSVAPPPPVLTPPLKKKDSRSNYDDMMDAILSLFSTRDSNLSKSCSMPNLIGDEETPTKKQVKATKRLISRKISTPVGVCMPKKQSKNSQHGSRY